ncbi:MAG: hypothetical protein COC05_04270 [Gammaproteobacteria bacterium]|nr:MAG: hypothetical protein COC05_04270 [Gammaproteobacteria bacterium]
MIHINSHLQIKHHWPPLLNAIVIIMLLSGCSTTSAPVPLTGSELKSEEYREQFNFLDHYDPFESINRRIYKFNGKFDEYFFIPVLRTYQTVTPRFVRSGVRNFFSNLNDIPVLLNSLLQLKPKSALVTTGRLTINTTIGIGGLWDPAKKVGLKSVMKI